MSDTCPNCGSALRDAPPKAMFQCGSYWATSPASDRVHTPACDLIRSLREELAAAVDAERDQIADWIENDAELPFGLHLHLPKIVHETCTMAAKALRNNEHRKGDQ